MNVLIFPKIDDPLGGIPRSRLNWCAHTHDALTSLGHNVFRLYNGSNHSLKTDSLKQEISNSIIKHYFYIKNDQKLLDISGLPKSKGGVYEHLSWRNLLMKMDLVWTRDADCIFNFYDAPAKVIFEYHDEDIQNKIFSDIKTINENKKLKIIAVTKPLKEKLLLNGINPKKVSVKGSGVLQRNANDPHQQKFKEFFLRKKFKKLVFYTGGLHSERDPQLIIDLAESFENVIFVIAGGNDELSESLYNYARLRGVKNLELLGFISQNLSVEIMQISDVLLYTRNKESIANTSPLKFYEYLNSSASIVHANIPDIDKRKFTKKKGFFGFRPSDKEDLLQAFSEACNYDYDQDKDRLFREQALKEHSWYQRTRDILIEFEKSMK